MTVLVVGAHPDDEVLGAGGAIARWTDAGRRVRACILSGNVRARQRRPPEDQLLAEMQEAHAVLGMEPAIIGMFENIAFNNTPHLDLVRFIEQAIVETSPTTIVTHHPADLNNDHLHTAAACQAAARLFQRRAGVARLNELLLMEVATSTDWAFASTRDAFAPNNFIEMSEAALKRKLSALACFSGVMRPSPHSRSREVITGWATVRGAQAGFRFAEAFQCVFRAEPNTE